MKANEDGVRWDPVKGPTGEHRSKGYVPHTCLHIASRVVGVGTGQAVHVTGLASHRWVILTTGRPGKAIPWKRTAVGGRWLAGSQQLWPVPRDHPVPLFHVRWDPFLGTVHGRSPWGVFDRFVYSPCLGTGLLFFSFLFFSFSFLFQSCD